MQLFYNPHITETDTDFNFDKEESRHIVKVLRKKPGEVLYISNGNGWLFKAELIKADIKNSSAIITESQQRPKRPFYLNLAVAPTKMNERFEWLLEKATEIGVEEITPLLCDHSERKTIKIERYQKIIQSAMKQSLQVHLPKLNPLTPFNDFVSQQHNGKKLIAHCEDSDKKSLKSLLEAKTNCTILIGPEGDFSSREIKIAYTEGFTPVTLGNTRLRTETAAITACHSVAFINEKE